MRGHSVQRAPKKLAPRHVKLTSRTLEQLKAQLIPALNPLADSLPVPPPTTADDIELWEETPDGPEDIGKLETNLSVAGMGWPRYKTIFVS